MAGGEVTVIAELKLTSELPEGPHLPVVDASRVGNLADAVQVSFGPTDGSSDDLNIPDYQDLINDGHTEFSAGDLVRDSQTGEELYYVAVETGALGSPNGNTQWELIDKAPDSPALTVTYSPAQLRQAMLNEVLPYPRLIIVAYRFDTSDPHVVIPLPPVRLFSISNTQMQRHGYTIEVDGGGEEIVTYGTYDPLTGDFAEELPTFTTDAVPEGSSNLYFTSDRAKNIALQAVLTTATIGATYNVGTRLLSLIVRPNSIGLSHIDPAALATGTLTGAQQAALSNSANWTAKFYNSSTLVLTGILAGTTYDDGTYFYYFASDNRPLRMALA